MVGEDDILLTISDNEHQVEPNVVVSTNFFRLTYISLSCYIDS